MKKQNQFSIRINTKCRLILETIRSIDYIEAIFGSRRCLFFWVNHKNVTYLHHNLSRRYDEINDESDESQIKVIQIPGR